jgi:aldose 1-epimerase
MIFKEESPFGVSRNNEPVKKYTLKNSFGLSAEFLTYGATIRSILVPDRNGDPADVALGYDTLEEYEQGTAFFGATVGRCANRIGGSAFKLNGRLFRLSKNEGENHLHGGAKGFDKAVWTCKEIEDGIVMEHFSCDLDEGYPGNLNAKVVFRLQGSKLIIEYEAESDKETPINLTNHTYFDLDGHDSGSITDHRLKIYADRYTPTDKALIPNGRILPVAGTPFDFRKLRPIGERINSNDDQLKFAAGYDQNFILADEPGTLRLAAELAAPKSGRAMAVYTTMPGLQFYSGNYLDQRGKNGCKYGKYGALCLETQFWPDAVNHLDFLSPVVDPGEIWRHTTIYDFNIRQV